MDDDVDPAHRHLKAVHVANVANEVAHALFVEILMHFKLLEFVAGVDDQLPWSETTEDCPDASSSKRAGAACDQDRLVVKHCGIPRSAIRIVCDRKPRASGFEKYRIAREDWTADSADL